jgi:SAM-dependent methyltransferase
MHPPPYVRRYRSDSVEYQAAFEAFLSHTDQKVKARDWLRAEFDQLRSRRILLDAGAGNGQLTAWAADWFERVIAIEPNPALAADLVAALPSARLVLSTILDTPAELNPADFVLCSHVFYYIQPKEWLANLDRLLHWLAPGGVLAIALQHPDTDCTRLAANFIGPRHGLAPLRQAIAELYPHDRFEVRIDTVPCRVRTPDLITACVVAEFMLNLLPIPSPPAWCDLERYVEGHFRQPGGGYAFSCDQDFLRVYRAGRGPTEDQP